MKLPTKLYEEGNFALYTFISETRPQYWWIRTTTEPIVWVISYYSDTRITLVNQIEDMTALIAKIPEKIMFMLNCIKSKL